MTIALTRRCAATLLLYGAAKLRGQSTSDPQFFRGTVTGVDAEHVVVGRTLVGQPPESRTFLLTPETSVGQGLAVKDKVTVHYEHQPEGDVALDIKIHRSATEPEV